MATKDLQLSIQVDLLGLILLYHIGSTLPPIKCYRHHLGLEHQDLQSLVQAGCVISNVIDMHVLNLKQ